MGDKGTEWKAYHWAARYVLKECGGGRYLKRLWQSCDKTVYIPPFDVFINIFYAQTTMIMMARTNQPLGLSNRDFTQPSPRMMEYN